MCGGCARQFWQTALAWNTDRLRERRDTEPPSLADQDAMVLELYEDFNAMSLQRSQMWRVPGSRLAQKQATSEAKQAAIYAARSAGMTRQQIKQAYGVHYSFISECLQSHEKKGRWRRIQPEDRQLVQQQMALGLTLKEICARLGLTMSSASRIKKQIRDEALPAA